MVIGQATLLLDVPLWRCGNGRLPLAEALVLYPGYNIVELG